MSPARIARVNRLAVRDLHVDRAVDSTGSERVHAALRELLRDPEPSPIYRGK